MDVKKEFWEEYCKLEDYFDKRAKLKTLPLLDGLFKIKDKEVFDYVVATSLQSYIDDIIEIMHK